MTSNLVSTHCSGYLRQWQIIGDRKRKTSAPILDISSATLWRWVNDPAKGFPKPYRLSAGVTAWKADEIYTWLAAQAVK